MIKHVNNIIENYPEIYIYLSIYNSYIQALDKQSKDGRIVAVKKIKLGSRFVARITSSYCYLSYLHDIWYLGQRLRMVSIALPWGKSSCCKRWKNLIYPFLVCTSPPGEAREYYWACRCLWTRFKCLDRYGLHGYRLGGGNFSLKSAPFKMIPIVQVIIKDQSLVLTPANIKSYTLQTLLGLEYLHQHWILHR